ncbi:hypothetical protein B0H19DRAFT_1058137 [Mycena capillaripes]|nr:hypothetical protein B0H19DRAFT_1058137 [Mycena capillaripes]
MNSKKRMALKVADDAPQPKIQRVCTRLQRSLPYADDSNPPRRSITRRTRQGKNKSKTRVVDAVDAEGDAKMLDASSSKVAVEAKAKSKKKVKETDAVAVDAKIKFNGKTKARVKTDGEDVEISDPGLSKAPVDGANNEVKAASKVKAAVGIGQEVLAESKPRGKEKDAVVDDAKVVNEEEHRQFKNAARRAAHRQEAQDNPEKAVEQRKESGRARCGLVSEVWNEQFCELVSAIETVQGVVAAYCAAENHCPIPPTAPVLASIPPRCLQLLAAAARDPTSFDITPFLANRTLVLSRRHDPAPFSTCANYIRRIETNDNPQEALIRYLCDYPADAPNTLLQLILQGHDLKKIREAFTSAMTDLGLEEAADCLLRAAEDKASLALFGSRRGTFLPYNGITCATACGDRGWDDVEGEHDVRIVNFLKSNPDLTWTTYHIPDLDTPLGNRLEVRTLPEVSEKERIVRAVFGVSALNSAHGGVRPIFVPTPPQVELLHCVRSLYTPEPSSIGSERDPALQAHLGELIDDEVRVVGPTHSIKIVPQALEAVKANLSQVLRLSNGKIVTLHIAKDIPLEAMKGRPASYWDAAVGPGPQEDRHLRILLHPDLSATNTLPIDIIAAFIGPFANFWRVTLWHILYWVHVLLLTLGASHQMQALEMRCKLYVN